MILGTNSPLAPGEQNMGAHNRTMRLSVHKIEATAQVAIVVAAFGYFGLQMACLWLQVH